MLPKQGKGLQNLSEIWVYLFDAFFQGFLRIIS